MPPNNSQRPTLPNDPYAFIKNSPAHNNKKFSFISPNTTKGRVILVSVVLGIVLVVGIVFMSILNSANATKAKQFIEIGQKQTEIIRLAAIGETKSNSLETRAYATTIKLSMITSQTDINKVIGNYGVSSKALSKELTKSKNSKSDQILDEAAKNNRFDETFKTLIDSEMQKFQSQINTVANIAKKNEKEILKKAFDQAGLILKSPTTKTN